MAQPEDSAQRALHRFQRWSLLVGLVGLALCAVGAFFNLDQFLRAYLMAYFFWLGIALGCLAIMMVHSLTGGAWGIVIHRFLEAGARTLPLLALLFVPLVFGLQHLYIWARPEAVAADALLQHKSAYLNVPFFLIRAAVYFVIWVGVSYLCSAGLWRRSGRKMSWSRGAPGCSAGLGWCSMGWPSRSPRLTG
jgi:hypothetical protein